jgi:hypothetical protein
VLDPAVFKAYDVRGLYPSQLDEDGATASAGHTSSTEPKAIAIGRYAPRLAGDVASGH